MDLTLQVPDGCSGLLRKKAGWETLSDAGLPHTKCHNCEEQLPAFLNPGADGEALQSQVLHEIGCPMGLQQRLDKGRRRVEGRLPNQLQSVRTPGYVLRPHE